MTRSAAVTLAAVLTALLSACSTSDQDPQDPPNVPQDTPMADPADRDPQPADAPQIEKIVRTDAEWRELLTPEQYYVTRQAGTEPPGSGEYLNNKQPGTYHCVACGLELFSSDTKYDSHCGWPSFYRTLAGDRVVYIEDQSHGMVRTEVRCARCDAHLGHVFDDGPQPTGNRYCMNSVALKFVPRDAADTDR